MPFVECQVRATGPRYDTPQPGQVALRLITALLWSCECVVTTTLLAQMQRRQAPRLACECNIASHGVHHGEGSGGYLERLLLVGRSRGGSPQEGAHKSALGQAHGVAHLGMRGGEQGEGRGQGQGRLTVWMGASGGDSPALAAGEAGLGVSWQERRAGRAKGRSTSAPRACIATPTNRCQPVCPPASLPPRGLASLHLFPWPARATACTLGPAARPGQPVRPWPAYHVPQCACCLHPWPASHSTHRQVGQAVPDTAPT